MELYDGNEWPETLERSPERAKEECRPAETDLDGDDLAFGSEDLLSGI